MYIDRLRCMRPTYKRRASRTLGLSALAQLQAHDKALLHPYRDAIIACLDGDVSARAPAPHTVHPPTVHLRTAHC